MTVRSRHGAGARIGLVAALTALLILGGAGAALANSAPPVPRTVSGHVTDSDGHGVEGVVVSAWTASVANDGTSSTWSNYATTDANGAYRIPDLAPAHYDVNVDLTAQPFLQWTDPVRKDVTEGDATLDFVAKRAGAVSGRTIDTHGGPVADDWVALGKAAPWGWTYDSWALSDQNGDYTLPKVTPGQYWVEFYQLAGPDDMSVLQSPTGRTDVTVTAGSVSTGPTGIFEAAAHIHGTIVDGATGFPVSFQFVSATRSGDGQIYQGFSQPDGSFDIFAPAGTYTIDSADEFWVYDARIIATAEMVEPGQQLDLGPCPVTSSRTDVHYIRGRVTDAQTGKPLDRGEVVLDMGGLDGYLRDIMTDAHGRFAILAKGRTSDLPLPHTYSVQFFSAPTDMNGDPIPYYVIQNTSVTVDTSDVERNAALDEGGRIYGRVTDGHGHPLAGVPVTVSGYSAGTSGYPGGTSGYPGGTSGYPGGTSGYPGGTSGYPRGTSGYTDGTAVTDANGRYVIGALESSSNYRVTFNGPGIWNAPPVSDLAFAYRNRPYFHDPITVSGYGEAQSVSGYDPVTVDYNHRTRGISQAIPVAAHLKLFAESADHPMGGVEILLDYWFRGSWVRVEHGFTGAGVLDAGPLPPGRYRVGWRDYFGRLDGSGDVREFRLAAGEAKTIALISASAGGSVPIGGGGTVTGSFVGAAGTKGVFKAKRVAAVPDPGGLPPGVQQLAGGAYNVSFSGPYQGVWTLTFPYGAGVSDAVAAQITVGHYRVGDGTWEVLTPTSIDTAHHTVTVQTASLSPFALLVPAQVKAHFSAAAASASHPFVGDSVLITTTLTNSVDGTPLSGRADVMLQSSPDGTTWTTSAAAVAVGPAGSYLATVAPTHAGAVFYRFTVPSQPPNFTGASSAAVKVTAVSHRASFSATVASNTHPHVGEMVSLTTTLTDSVSGLPMLGRGDITLQSSSDGSVWTTSPSVVTTGPAGAYQASVTPSVAGTVRYRFIIPTQGELLIGDTSAPVSIVARAVK